MNDLPKIGAFVLETLTTGMYSDPLDSIREYIQNSSDSIFAAEKLDVISKNTGRINIDVNPEKRTLTIRDNGMGISSSEVYSKLLNIGMSSKTYGLEAGFRGIGRLAGIAYCKQLIFTTSFPDEKERCSITFDCEGIRKAISPSMRQVEELADVISKNTKQDIETDSKDSHFFEVRLNGIDSNIPQFLDIILLEEYLSQVAPIEYDAQKFTFAPKIEQWAEKNKFSIPYVKLLISSPELGDPRQVFKAFRRSYKTRKGDYNINIKDVKFRKGTNENGASYWMWYSETDLLGMFDDLKVAGLRFRKNNISIGGPERVAELFPGNEGRLNYWLIGEIHVCDDNIIPNARRDGFESTHAWDKFNDDISLFIKDHCKACHDASGAVNRPIAKILSTANTTINNAKKALSVSLGSTEEREDLLKKFDKEEERLQSALSKRQDYKEKTKIQQVLSTITDLRNELAKQEVFTVGKVNSKLDRKQRRILVEIMEIIDKSLRERKCKQSQECFTEIKRQIINKYGM